MMVQLDFEYFEVLRMLVVVVVVVVVVSEKVEAIFVYLVFDHSEFE